MLVIITLLLTSDLQQTLTLANLKSQQATIESYYGNHPFIAVGCYALAYIVMAGLNIPGAALMTLAAGAIFGLIAGTIIVSFVSSIGATVAFLIARFLLRDIVQAWFGPSLETVNQGIEKEGALYLFGLRLVPIFPFFVINVVMALTPLRATTFYWVSQAGMLAGTAVYVNAGTQLARLESAKGILSPVLLGSFALIGVLPWVARRVLGWVRARRSV